ncbi:hypothetical protein FOZ61_009571 [Perkinsus olseni]|nr:hypothetical protein FOZ61_009571 [Perkinsus olseni]
MSSSLFLGFDLSTQSCKAVVLDENLDTVFSTTVKFDEDLPQYHTSNGVSIKESSGEVKSPSAMFSSALQLCIRRLQHAGCPMERIVGIGGSGQQHGSVYLSAAATDHLLPDDDNVDDLGKWQLENGVFTVRDGPIWMDTSTSAECRELESYVGGSDALAKLTGSKAWERFTGNQILKFRKQSSGVYGRTARICLVSSFCASVLLGQPTRVDYSDAAGMNLMELSSLNWSRGICGFIDGRSSDGLISKLGGQPADSMAIAGTVAPYWQQRYGFSPICSVNYWSGDNPCAAVGMGLLNSGDILVSLGTSDTCLCVLPSMPLSPPPSAFIFPHPVKPGWYIAMLVYTNGDVTRRAVKGDRSWDEFSDSIRLSSPGNYLTLCTSTQEILPALEQGDPVTVKIENKNDAKVTFSRFEGVPKDGPDYSSCRAVVEERALSMRYYINSEVAPGILEQFPGGKLLVTGGGSRNEQIRQVFSDVFRRSVVALDSPDAAALGAAYKAMLATAKQRGTLKEGEKLLQDHISATENTARNLPDASNSLIYGRISRSYAAFEKVLRDERGR